MPISGVAHEATAGGLRDRTSFLPGSGGGSRGGRGATVVQKSREFVVAAPSPASSCPCASFRRMFKRSGITLCPFRSQHVEDRIEAGYSRERDQADTEKIEMHGAEGEPCNFCHSLSSSSFSLFQFLFSPILFPHCSSVCSKITESFHSSSEVHGGLRVQWTGWEPGWQHVSPALPPEAAGPLTWGFWASVYFSVT